MTCARESTKYINILNLLTILKGKYYYHPHSGEETEEKQLKDNIQKLKSKTNEQTPTHKAIHK